MYKKIITALNSETWSNICELPYSIIDRYDIGDHLKDPVGHGRVSSEKE